MSQHPQPSLPTLQWLKDRLNSNPINTEALFPFIVHLDTLPKQEKDEAIRLICSHFVKDYSSGRCTFTRTAVDKFQLLTAKKLSQVIRTLKDDRLEREIFVTRNQEYLSHYPIRDLLYLLDRHQFTPFDDINNVAAAWNDPFVAFVCRKFMEQPVSTRLDVLKDIKLASHHVCAKILNKLGPALSDDELILVWNTFLNAYTWCVACISIWI